MTRRVMLLVAVSVVLTIGSSESTVYCAVSPRIAISEIKANPIRYSGRKVTLFGILDSAHLGVFLRDKTSGEIIRLRFVSPQNTENVKVVLDSLYKRLEELATKTDLPGQPLETFEVRIVGLIRVVPEGARPDKIYYPQIEAPIEATLIRVLSISKAIAKE